MTINKETKAICISCHAQLKEAKQLCDKCEAQLQKANLQRTQRPDNTAKKPQ